MKITALLSLLLILTSFDKPAWRLLSGKGQPISYNELLKKCSEADIILFGEFHNNPIHHWLQYELARDLLERHPELTLGGEFFETDDQLIINEWLRGLLEYRHFEAEVKIWPNFKTDYWPLLLFAKTNQLPFIATNIPRRYASIVARHGMDSLYSIQESASALLPPLPVEINEELPGYKAMMEMSAHSGMKYMMEAQAIKDATMAYSILKNHRKGQIFLHINGAYHSNNYEGIYWYLKKSNPNLRVVTIGCAEQENISKPAPGYKGLADFIILTPTSLTKTH